MANCTTVAECLANAGITYNPATDPFADVEQIVAARNCPASVPTGSDPISVIEVWCIAFMISRIWYQKCGANWCGLSGASQSLGTAGQLGQPGVADTGLAALGIGSSVASSFTGGLLSVILGPLESLLQQKAELEEQEDQILGKVATAWNQTIPQLDAGVAAGAIDVTTASEQLTSVVSQLISQIETLVQKNCDASCEFICQLNAQLDFTTNFYWPAIAPGGTLAQKPGNAPGVAVAVGSTTLNSSPASTVNGTPAAAGSASTIDGISTTTFIIVGAVIVLIVVLFAMEL